MNRTWLSLRLLRTEAVITTIVFSMPVMNPFFYSIGMDQGEIGLSQAAFTVAVLMLNIPTGWLADRFSRKGCNAFGDLLACLGFGGYAFAQNLEQVILWEVVIGIGLAFTQGADVALLRGYCKELKRTLTSEMGFINKWSPIAQMLGVIAGGAIGSWNPRLTFVLTAVMFLAGAILSLYINESGERLQQQHRNPFKDMASAIHGPVSSNPRLRWLIVASAVSREITHPIIWVLTPMMVLAGVPAAVIGSGWALNLMAVSIGSTLGGRYGLRFNETARYAMPMAACLISLSVLSLQISPLTIGFYTVFGLARGWTLAVMRPMVQAHAPADRAATIESVSSSLAQLLYIPLVWGVNTAGNQGVQWAFAATLAVFAPLVGLTVYKLQRYPH